MTVSPSVALRDALAAYLAAKLPLVAGLEDSTVRTTWVEPQDDLVLGPTAVVVSVIQAGEPRVSAELGPPRVSRVKPDDVFRYVYRYVDQDLTIGVWAHSEAMRDDADEVIFRLLSVPYWQTVTPRVSTTSTLAIPVGDSVITPASMSDVWPGTRLRVDTGAGVEEYVDVLEIGVDRFRARFRRAHAAGCALVEVPARREIAAGHVSLRLATHYDVVGSFVAEEARPLDTGATVQRQEWQSIRTVVASAPHVREISQVRIRTRTLRAQAATTNPEAAPLVETDAT